ncbi:Zn-dependent hydrolase [Mesorhizobium sp.]|uniref:Zn-dependent hydrolase n=1 Tax=Mesorhizobium sp. TaxID=1871066 RepID=UPI0025D64B5B|nr:Zn-dependent hydrolase [Mesorhizobium sp.]
MAQPINIDPEHVERLILDLGEFGAHSGTGVWRTVYSPECVAAAKHFAGWCAEAGLAVHHDAVGNVWGRLEGREAGPSIVSGSHIDSQKPGGRYDGALGAIAALVAIDALARQFGKPRRTLEVLALCEEEGSRFAAASLWGSRAITGCIEPRELDELLDHDGVSIRQAMQDAGLDPNALATAERDDIDTFVELHIEQGPVLEAAGLGVGLVTAINGLRHYRVELTGEANHAGAFPMDARRDPMAGFAEIASGVISTAERWGRPAVTTVGQVNVEPNLPAIIPAKVSFMIDARHPDPDAVQRLYSLHENLIREVADRRGLGVKITVLENQAPLICHPEVVAAIKATAEEQGIRLGALPSGGSHDTQQMSRIARAGMIFVRSKDGRSHTPEEFSSIDDIVDAIKVLAGTLYKLAY